MKAGKSRQFQKGRAKTGGRVKGVPNKSTAAIKDLLELKVSDENLWKRWLKKLNSDDEHIAMKAFELLLHYRYGKPIQPIVGEEFAPPIKIDISAIPKHLVPA